MRHYICEVSPREFRILAPDGLVILSESAEMEKFVDMSGEPKLTNLVHQQAWRAIQNIYAEKQ